MGDALAVLFKFSLAELLQINDEIYLHKSLFWLNDDYVLIYLFREVYVYLILVVLDGDRLYVLQIFISLREIFL